MSIRVIDVIEEAKHFESESRSLHFADPRGVANIHWNHSEQCKAASSPDTERCTCSRGIFTAEHLEHYERNLRLTEVDPNQRAVVPFNSEVVTIRVKEKKSVIYAYLKRFGAAVA